MRIDSLLFVGATLALTSLWAPRTADACSLPNCRPPRAFSHASIPENAGGVWAFPGLHGLDAEPFLDGLVLRSSGSDGDLAMEIVMEPEWLTFDGRVALHMSDPLAHGMTLSLVDTSPDCDETFLYDPDEQRPEQVVQTWEIGPAAAEPSALGMLSVTYSESGEAMRLTGTACNEVFATRTARIELAPDESFEPWADAVVYETWVDGAVFRPDYAFLETFGPDAEPPFGGSWAGRGVDVLYANCTPGATIDPERDGLAPGEHTVMMRAILPDGTVVETPSVTVTIECAGSEGTAGGGGCSAAGPGSAGGLLALLGVALAARRHRRA